MDPHTNTWTYYWAFIIWLSLMKAIARQQQTLRKRRQMGPRINITPSEFEKLAEKERGLVIKARVLWAGTTYLLRSGDYYYWTTTKTPLDLPEECEIQESKQILL